MKFSFLKSLTKKSAIYFAGMVTTIGLATAYAAWPAGVDTLVHKTAGDPVPSTDWNTIVDALKESKARIAALETKPTGGVDWTPNPAYDMRERNVKTYSAIGGQTIQVSKVFVPQQSGMYYTYGNLVTTKGFFSLSLRKVSANNLQLIISKGQYDSILPTNTPFNDMVHLEKGVQYAFYMGLNSGWPTATIIDANYIFRHVGSDI